MKLQLTNDNYFSEQAERDYMSVSQFKDFAGTLGKIPCERTAVMKLNNLIVPDKTKALLVGSYIDAYFEGTLEAFKAENPDIFKKTGDKGLKAEYVQAENIIERINADDLFSDYMSGQKQIIMTGNLFDIDWKIKIDSYHPDNKIVDLKIMKDMKSVYSPRTHEKMDFVRYWGYDIQGAVYQKIVEIKTGKRLPFFLCVATKEKPSDIEVIEITQKYLDSALDFVKESLPHVLSLKSGLIQPTRCDTCSYCRLSKKLIQPVPIDNFIRNKENEYESEHEDDDEIYNALFG